MLFTCFYFKSWPPMCLLDGNHLCKFDRGHYLKDLCKKYLNLGQWLMGRCLKFFLFFLFSSGANFVQQSKPICAIIIRVINLET